MTINFKDTDTQKVYLSSDLHLGHQRDFVFGARGYKDAPDHDAGVIDTINQLVGPNDILILLGDFCLNTPLEQFNAYLDRIQCQNIYAMFGNHNNPHEKKVFYAGQPKSNVKGIQTVTYPFAYKNMVFLPHYVESILNGQYTILCHYPMLVWNEMSHGSWMLCGHSHYGCPATVASNPNGKILDVGWDGHKKPLSIPEIAQIMSTKQFVATDDHHRPSAEPKVSTS